MTNPATIGIGLLGCGTVGSAFVALVYREQERIAERTGVRLEIRSVAVRDAHRDRHLGSIPVGTDPLAVVNDPSVDVVVELMGGTDTAGSAIEAALGLGKPVVTGNKELLALRGSTLSALAERHDTVLLYEAAVAGGIPVLRSLRESLAGEPVTTILGIVNGTTNYILTRMAEDAMDYSDALADATAMGYAEADPTADVEAFDAAAKAVIIADVAFGASVPASAVYREGISALSSEDITTAADLGYVIKLIARVERHTDGRVGVRVHPMMVPIAHPLAAVRLSFNALFVDGEAVGELMFYGRGAGGPPTASAVLGDVLDAARRPHAPARPSRARSPELWPIEQQSSAFCLTLHVSDRAGVLSAVAGVFGEHDISIRSMEQLGLGDEARLVFITHSAQEARMTACLARLEALDAVRHVGNVVRVLA